MSAFGDMIEGYEKQIQIGTEGLEQIKLMPVKLI